MKIKAMKVLIEKYVLISRFLAFLKVKILGHFVIKTSDKKYERRFDRSTVILKLKFME